MPDESIWSYPIEVAAIHPEGQSFTLVPDEATRQRLAGAANVVSIPSLKVVMEARPMAAGAVEISGKLEGIVRQTCVVSLDEFDNPVAENILADFATDPESKASTEDEEEIEDLPDPIVDGKIDLGALAAEFLILSVDPYPRKPGAEFSPLPADEAEEAPKRSPFEQLAGLKNRIKK
jgi:uncharacterized metal-binding protein YceD (DUF177 family)